MPNPSTTEVVEFREQIALGDDAGGVNRDRMWALELFGTKWQYPWAEILVGSNPDLICVGEPANRGLESQFPVVHYSTPCSMAGSVSLIIGGEDDARFRPN
jgi:hypothetical protein